MARAHGKPEALPLSADRILVLSKLKAFTPDKLNVAQNIKFVFHWQKTLWLPAFILFTEYFNSLPHNPDF